MVDFNRKSQQVLALKIITIRQPNTGHIAAGFFQKEVGR
jgi:hypothetical protein